MKNKPRFTRFEFYLTRALYGFLTLLAGLVIAAILAGCGKAPPPSVSADTPEPDFQAASTTATPQEPPATATVVPSATALPSPTPWAYPTPFYDPALQWPGGLPPIVPPVGYAWDSDIEVFVALGSDYASWRTELATGTDNTDAFIIVIVRHDPPGVSLVSVPRDLYVFIPGFGMSRINTAWKLGGPEMVADTIRYNFGLPMDGYGYVRMEAFANFIDAALGGIDVSVTKPVVDHCTDIQINYATGLHHMDGATALCYARVRMFDGGFNRQTRQRDVLKALKDRFLAMAGDDPAVLAVNMVEAYISERRYTDVGVPDLLRLVPVMLHAQIIDYQIDYEIGIVQYNHPATGAWLVLPPPPTCVNELMTMAVLGIPWDVLPEACP